MLLDWSFVTNTDHHESWVISLPKTEYIMVFTHNNHCCHWVALTMGSVWCWQPTSAHRKHHDNTGITAQALLQAELCVATMVGSPACQEDPISWRCHGKGCPAGHDFHPEKTIVILWWPLSPCLIIAKLMNIYNCWFMVYGMYLYINCTLHLLKFVEWQNLDQLVTFVWDPPNV